MNNFLTIIFLAATFLNTAHPPEVVKIKKEVEQQKSHPDLACMGKVLMVVGGLGFAYFRLIKLGRHQHINPDEHKRCQEFQRSVLQFSYSTYLAGFFGYCIGRKYYPQKDSSLKNLFSRAALAQKIFNI